MRVLNHANLTPEAVAGIVRELSAQENLKDVMAWAFSYARGTFIPSVVAEVIVQDEFTHDVIVPWRDALVLVYDTTCLVASGTFPCGIIYQRPSKSSMLD